MMFTHKAFFAFAAVFVASSLPTAVAELIPSDSLRSILDSLASSFATQTSSTSMTQTTFSTSTTGVSSASEELRAPPSFTFNTSIVLKSSSTTQSIVESACSQPPAAGQKRPTLPGFNFTDRCDATSIMAEDCRVTLACDTERGLYPTCHRGECKCLAKECIRRSMCLQHRQCRSEFEEHTCEKHNETMGTCACRPRITSCLFERNPHHYCASDFNCTERYFSLYPEFAHCNTGDSKYPTGYCDCRYFGCERDGSDKDFEVCKDLIDCRRSPLGHRPFCNLKYLGGTDAKDGYCTCVP